ncbi:MULTISPECIES: hypothetical protein [unclassified Sporosarcina]|uniref:hypothetical protein n=1 Tax=unclassified Sporosarcina TaxID=2647733 RepID=UPI001180FF41|nr:MULTISPECIES: hypothetical protein [unclassified Sporosarcina]
MKSEPTRLSKNIIWHIEQTEYVVRNVPYVKHNADGEQFIDANVAITITALRDLMADNLIPNDVNFEDFAHIEF